MFSDDNQFPELLLQLAFNGENHGDMSSEFLEPDGPYVSVALKKPRAALFTVITLLELSQTCDVFVRAFARNSVRL